MKCILILIVSAFYFLFDCTVLYAQQDLQLSQYMFNKLVYNPASTGSEKNILASAAFRTQWIGFDGQPITQTVSIQSPLNKLHGGVGLYLVNDVLGIERTTSFMVSYAYNKKLYL